MDKIFIATDNDVFEALMKKLPVVCPTCNNAFIASAENVAPEQAICPHCKQFVQIHYKN